MISRKLLALVIVPVAILLALSGCTQTPNQSADNNLGYATGDPYKEIKPADRKAPVAFSGLTDVGKKVSNKDYTGKVLVLNFWYAGCGPCIAEAPRLDKVYAKYGKTVEFLGVNTYDQAPTALNFERNYKVGYPSVIDTNDAAVQYSFSKYIPPNAVPTTLVIDQHGRVAARVTGPIYTPTILGDLLDTVIDEGS